MEITYERNDDEFIEDEYDVDEEIDNNKLMAYDIAVFYNTYNLSTLLKWWGKKLVIPDFQRPYVWNMTKASEFVDSMLRGLPVPSMFFYDDSDNSRLLVVDGQQRLNSLCAYIETQSYFGKKFRLIGNIHPNWKGKTYDELNQEDKDRLDDSLMNITVMRQLAPDDGQSAMYLAFQRINTGGITLRAQEIRMAVSFGPLAKYLSELSIKTSLNKLMFLRSKSQRENENYSPIQELILKFWTYYFRYPDFSGSSTRAMLDDFFSEQKDFEKPVRRKQGKRYIRREEFEEAYEAVVEIIANLSEDVLSPYTKPTQTFLEAIWVGLTYRKLKLHKDIDEQRIPEIVQNWKSTMGEEKFSEMFQARRTSSIQSALARIRAGIDYFSGDFDA